MEKFCQICFTKIKGSKVKRNQLQLMTSTIKCTLYSCILNLKVKYTLAWSPLCHFRDLT